MVRSTLLLLAAAVLAAAGCSTGSTGGVGPSREPSEGLLYEVADLLRTPERPPGKQADLARFESLHPRAFQGIKAGEVVVLWGTPMMGEGDALKGGAGTVIAYEKNAPTAGGWALYTSGEVKKVGPADIPKAGGKK